MSTTAELESRSEVYAFPAVPLQKRLWMLNTPCADPAWNVAVRFRLDGHLAATRLQAALNSVVARTEILRTGFAMADGELRQVVTDPLSVPLRQLDPSHSGNFEHDLDQISRAEAEIPFRMDEPSLLRVVLVSRHAEEHYLLVTAHHAIMDGYSVGLFSDALMAAYGSSEVRGEQADTDAPLQFADYALWLEGSRQTADYRQHLAYWERMLHDALLTGQSSAGGKVPRGPAHIESLLLPRSLTDAAQKLSQRLDVTFPQMALAVFACAANRLNTTIGVPVASRTELQLETMIGPFVNYLPLKLTAAPGASFELLLANVAEILREALGHSETRYEDMLEAKGAPAGSLFDAVFICQRDFVQPRTLHGIALTPIPSVSPGALHELTTFLVERNDGWRLSCETDDRHEAGFASSLLERYRHILEAVCNDPSIPVASIVDGAGISPPLVSQLRQPEESTSASHSFRMSATQERYWALNRIDPGSNRLNLHIRYEVEGALDRITLREALHILTLRHDALRTSFSEEGGELRQHVGPAIDVPLHFHDAPAGTLDAGTIDRLLEREKQLSFDIENGPLWSVLVVAAGPRNYLSLTLSHIISDGWSCGVLVRELLVAYDAIVAKEPAAFPPLPYSFAQVAEQEQREESRNLAERLAYWDEVLGSPSSVLHLPADAEQGAASYAAVEVRTIDPMLSAAVTQVARDHSVTAATVYAAAYRALLLKYTGSADLLIASPTANRPPGTENMVGPFADSLIVRSTIGSTFEEALEATQHSLLSAVEHRLPLQALMERVRHSGGVQGAAIPLGFMYQEAFVHDLEGAQLTLRTMDNPIVESSFDWHLAVIDRQGEVTVEFTANRATTTQQLASLIVDDFELSLSGYVVAPRKLLARVLGSTQRVQQRCSSAQTRKPNETPVPEAPAPVRVSAASLEETAKMVQVWQTVFGRSEVTANDNFFALGGHSLLLARLQVALEKEFGYRIFAADIFAAPTCKLLVQRMAHFRQRTSPVETRIIAVQPEGTETPLFVISQSMIIRELAQHLKPKQPTFTIQFIQEDVDLLGPDATMQQVAALYIEHLRAARPSGPYRLGGWCISGWVVYEMAQQLKASGEDVELLLILDAWAPNFWRDMKGFPRALGRMSYYAHRAYFKMLQLLPVEQTRTGLRVGFQPLRPTVWRRFAETFGVLTSEPVETTRLDDSFDQTMKSAIDSFRPAPYHDKRTLVFRSAEQPRGGTLPDDMGWYSYLPNTVEVVALPGDHTGMFSGRGVEIMSDYISRMVAGDQTRVLWQEGSSEQSSHDLLNAPSCPR